MAAAKHLLLEKMKTVLFRLFLLEGLSLAELFFCLLLSVRARGSFDGSYFHP